MRHPATDRLPVRAVTPDGRSARRSEADRDVAEACTTKAATLLQARLRVAPGFARRATRNGGVNRSSGNPGERLDRETALSRRSVDVRDARRDRETPPMWYRAIRHTSRADRPCAEPFAVYWRCSSSRPPSRAATNVPTTSSPTRSAPSHPAPARPGPFLLRDRLTAAVAPACAALGAGGSSPSCCRRQAITRNSGPVHRLAVTLCFGASPTGSRKRIR